jgi:hypothetical protein
VLGVLGGVGRWLGAGGIGDDGAGGVVITAYVLLGGVLSPRSAGAGSHLASCRFALLLMISAVTFSGTDRQERP